MIERMKQKVQFGGLFHRLVSIDSRQWEREREKKYENNVNLHCRFRADRNVNTMNATSWTLYSQWKFFYSIVHDSGPPIYFIEFNRCMTFTVHRKALVSIFFSSICFLLHFLFAHFFFFFPFSLFDSFWKPLCSSTIYCSVVRFILC